MKKINNKFRNNNNNYSNQIYSLNYKFDSTSIAGKVSGTALDLIKKYNELAKDAHSNSDYVSAEIFRQYAEHYRKIVTDINEKKNQKNAALKKDCEKNNIDQDNNISNDNMNNNTGAVLCENGNGTDKASEAADTLEVSAAAPQAAAKKEFTVIEIVHTENDGNFNNDVKTEPAKAKRVYRKKAAAV